MQPEENSTIDKAGVIRNVIRLLPTEYQNSHTNAQDSWKIEEINRLKYEEGISDEDELDKIEAGCFLWDLTILPEQALFLADLNVIPILLHLISNTNSSDRLLVKNSNIQSIIFRKLVSE
jgi:hypothetical protein